MLTLYISILLSIGTPQLTLSGTYETTSGEYTALQFNADGSGSYTIDDESFSFSSHTLTSSGSMYHLDFTIQSINVYGVVKDLGNDQIGFFSYTDQSLRNAHASSDEFTTLTKQQ